MICDGLRLRGIRRVLLVGFVLCASVGRCRENEAADSSNAAGQSPFTVVTLGDSITKGVRQGVANEQTFASLIEGQLKQQHESARVTNVGIGGERTDQALRRLESIIASEPDVVTVMYGTNDSYVDKGKTTSRITVEAYRDNLESIVAQLLERGILPVLMTEPRWSDDAGPNGLGENPNVQLEPYVQTCRDVAAHWRVPLVDHYAHWSDSRKNGVNLRSWTTDGCHPNPTGHAEIAKTMASTLESAFDTVGRPSMEAVAKLHKERALRVVCFGDSVTGVYYHTGSRRAYTDMLGIALGKIAPEADIQMVNAGISGNTTVNGLGRIEKDVLAHRPDVVTVMFGLNDMTRVPLAQYRANLREIVTKCRAIGAEVVLATPNNVIDTSSRPTDKLVKYCDVVREVGRELDVRVCDTYRELMAFRHHDAFGWRLLMSDEIHPNMDGHKRIAEQLTRAIMREHVSLDDVAPLPNRLSTVLARNEKTTLKVLAMPPYDEHIKMAVGEVASHVTMHVETWDVAGKTLAEIEVDAKQRVRSQKPDLVVLAVPRSAAAADAEAFAKSYAWVMNWSLNFGSPTWDCIVVHPAVADPAAGEHDALVRQLVQAQDLLLVDRPAESTAEAAEILRNWLRQRQQEESP